VSQVLRLLWLSRCGSRTLRRPASGATRKSRWNSGSRSRNAVCGEKRSIATQLDPTYAAAFNNLAIAYEHEGLLDKARTAYEKALAIEPGNQMIQQNFDLFKEINDRAAKKDPR
jgi:tetratricopeptide (TPR) repeat protein